MRNTILGFAIAGALIALPLAASAQSVDVQSQIASLLAQIKVLQQQLADLVAQIHTSTSGAGSSTTSGGGSAVSSVATMIAPSMSGGLCSLARTLSVGSTGDDVTNLQEFLQGEGVFTVQPTGYFGPITASAVAKWQASQGIESVGIVGPITRARIAARCGGTIPPTSALQASPTSGQAPLAVSFWYLLGGSSADGYSIDFGDGSTATPTIGCGGYPNAMSAACPRALVASHTYVSDGSYTATLTQVVNPLCYDSGCMMPSQIKTVGSVQITVGARATVCTQEYAPVCGRPSGCVNTCAATPGTACPMIASMLCRLPDPQTYSNSCEMKAAGATLLYQGACTSTTAGEGTLSGTLSIGPICPVETYPPSPQCSPSAATYAAHQIYITSSAGGTTALTAHLDGSFSTSLAAGDYTLTVQNASCSASTTGTISCSGIGSGGSSIPLHISAGVTTSISINVDTGIR
jgi:peptidoglycan hydrolase-like protein with peptidoglycan-binding domain